MGESKPVGTLMVTGMKLSKEDTTGEVDQTQYRFMIEKLQYVVHSRPDIALAIGIVARFSSNPKETHMTAMKRIFRYLKGIEDYGVWYKQEDDFKVYTDADWAGNVDDSKNTIGVEFSF